MTLLKLELWLFWSFAAWVWYQLDSPYFYFYYLFSLLLSLRHILSDHHLQHNKNDQCSNTLCMFLSPFLWKLVVTSPLAD
jgi:hypothetical protein